MIPVWILNVIYVPVSVISVLTGAPSVRQTAEMAQFIARLAVGGRTSLVCVT